MRTGNKNGTCTQQLQAEEDTPKLLNTNEHIFVVCFVKSLATVLAYKCWFWRGCRFLPWVTCGKNLGEEAEGSVDSFKRAHLWNLDSKIFGDISSIGKVEYWRLCTPIYQVLNGGLSSPNDQHVQPILLHR